MNHIYLIKNEIHADAKRCLLGYGMSNLGYEMEADDLQKDPKGKPYDKKGRIELSFSDNANYSVLAISDLPVGIDIEEKRAVTERIMRVLPEEEQHFLSEADDKELAFLLLWTLRESYVKMTGEGLSKACFAISFAEAARTLLAGDGRVHLSNDAQGPYYQRYYCWDKRLHLSICSRSPKPFEISKKTLDLKMENWDNR